MWTEKLSDLFATFLLQKQFVFRFFTYEKNGVANDAEVVQYEFVNQGDTFVDIEGMRLYPQSYIDVSGYPKNNFSWKSDIKQNEMDVTVYKWKFVRTPAATSQCIGTIKQTHLVPCLPPTTCTYHVVVNLVTTTGTISLGVGFDMTCLSSEADINAAWAAQCPYDYSAVWTYDGTGLQLVLGAGTISLYPDNTTGLQMIITTSGTGCEALLPIEAPMICSFLPQVQKLLVISKVKATVRSKKP